jgi:hypothetical protein
MSYEEIEPKALPGRAKRARRTHFWTHLCLAIFSFALAALFYRDTGRYVLACIFAGVGLIQLIHAFVNPFKSSKN